MQSIYDVHSTITFNEITEHKKSGIKLKYIGKACIENKKNLFWKIVHISMNPKPMIWTLTLSLFQNNTFKWLALNRLDLLQLCGAAFWKPPPVPSWAARILSESPATVPRARCTVKRDLIWSAVTPLNVRHRAAGVVHFLSVRVWLKMTSPHYKHAFVFYSLSLF